MNTDFHQTRHGLPGRGRLITKEEVREFYDRTASHLDRYRKRNSFYFREMGALLRSVIPEGSRILDVGCGQGDFLDLLRPSYGLGVDISPAMIERARTKYPHLDFAVADAEELEPRITFDYVLLANLVGYLQDIQTALQRLTGVCTADTRVVITHYNYLWEPVLRIGGLLGMKMREPYQNWLSIQDLENLLHLAGFEVVRSRQVILLPKYVPLLSRLCNRYLSQMPLFRRLALVELLVARPVRQQLPERALTCSIIVPARNEQGNIGPLVQRIPRLGDHTEIIFVEGHSGDGTAEEIRRVAAAHSDRDIKLLAQEGEGKADAVRTGLEHAGGDILMILDADLSVAPEDLGKFYEAIASGKTELAIGNRLVYPLQRESMRFLNLLGNKFFSMAFSYLLEQRIKDTLCGAKALLRKHYRTIAANRRYFGSLDPFGDFDLIFGAAKANLRIAEIPVRYQARTYGETQIRRFRHGVLLFRMVCIAARKLRFTGGT